MRLWVGFLFVALALPANGALLDPDSPAAELLDRLTPLLHQHNMDVARNLNASACKPDRKPRRPRLGMLADIPAGSLADSQELTRWEDGYARQEIAAIAALPARSGSGDFKNDWFNASPTQRVLVTYAVPDRRAADVLARQLQHLQYVTRHFTVPELDGASRDAARYYATAGQRLVLDSTQARKLGKKSALEIQLLGKKLYRRGDSVFAASGKSSRYYYPGEPERFRKADLGDENSAATIPEIIVSGGIALGEKARFERRPAALEFSADHGFQLVYEGGDTLRLPAADPLLLKACFDFAVRSLRIASDAIIDIDERRKIKISNAFRNTAIGYELIGIDERPFQYVDNLSAIKSVIIDTSVAIFASDMQAVFATGYEVRFINPDRRKLAETRVALVYDYDSASGIARFRDSWGPRAFRLKRVDYAGLGQATHKAAVVAGWSALFREVEDSRIDFSRGRYEFLQIDKTGTTTPRFSAGD